MTVRYVEDRIEAYLDANFQPVAPERAVYVRAWAFTDDGPLLQLIKLDQPAAAP